jgi:hypothetical protein
VSRKTLQDQGAITADKEEKVGLFQVKAIILDCIRAAEAYKLTKLWVVSGM